MTYKRYSVLGREIEIKDVLEPYFFQKFAPYAYSPAAIPAIGRVFLNAIEVPVRMRVSGVRVYRGTVAAAGNHLTIGLYRNGALNKPDAAALIDESVSTVFGAASLAQDINFAAEQILDPDLYWIGLEADAIAEDLIWVGRYASFVAGSAFDFARYYDRGGGYGAFTTPCPASTGTAYIWLTHLIVKEVLRS